MKSLSQTNKLYLILHSDCGSSAVKTYPHKQDSIWKKIMADSGIEPATLRSTVKTKACKPSKLSYLDRCQELDLLYLNVNK